MELSQNIVKTCLLELLAQAGGTPPIKAPQIGLPENLIYKIQNLTNREMTRLATTYSSSILQITVDVEKLAMFVSNIKTIEEENNAALEFVKRDASMPLMEKLFGIGPTEFAAMRKAVGMPPSKGGKPTGSIEDRLEILAIWDSLDDVEDLRQKYLQVADMSSLSLRSIHMVVMQRESERLERSESCSQAKKSQVRV